MDKLELQQIFFGQLFEHFTGESLFDQLTDIVFFIKNAQGEYVVVNETLVQRCNGHSKDDLIGKTPKEVYPSPFGLEYQEQDQRILDEGKLIINKLEIHTAPSLDLYWCLTTKVPLHGQDRSIVGIAGVSRDLVPFNKKSEDYSRIAESVAYIKENFPESLKVDELAGMAGLSSFQYEQRMQKIFSLTVGQFIQKTRIEAAMWQLRETENSAVSIALNCGYADQSAFSRQFKKTIGLTPVQYRQVFSRK
jgi:AraC-like DNA-binding protein